MPERRKTTIDDKQVFFQRQTHPAGNLVRDERKGVERRVGSDKLYPAKTLQMPYISNITDMNLFGVNMQNMQSQLNSIAQAVVALAIVAERRKF